MRGAIVPSHVVLSDPHLGAVGNSDQHAEGVQIGESYRPVRLVHTADAQVRQIGHLGADGLDIWNPLVTAAERDMVRATTAGVAEFYGALPEYIGPAHRGA